MNNYKNINTKEFYDNLIHSGMFFEFFPELTGDWNVDKIIILKEQNEDI
jgi:hypothetical protein